MAVSAGTVVAGAPWIHSNKGAAYVFVPSQLFITTASLPNGVAGVPYSQMLSAAGGMPPYTWQVTSGRLPRPVDAQLIYGTDQRDTNRGCSSRERRVSGDGLNSTSTRRPP